MILVVDDEALVAEALTDILEVLGYEAVSAARAQEAMTLLENYGQAIKLAIVDLKLHGENGINLFQRLKRREPHIKGILTSGNPPQNGDRRWEEQGFDRCLAKPFSIDQVAGTVEQVLANAPQMQLADTGELSLI